MRHFLLFVLCLLPLAGMAQDRKVAVMETVDKEGKISYAVKMMLRSNLSKAIADLPGFEVCDKQQKGVAYHFESEVVQVDEKNVFVMAKLLNVETAKVEAMDNVQMGTAADAIKQGSEQLVEKLFGAASAGEAPSAPKKSAQKSESGVQGEIGEVGDLCTFTDGTQGVIYYKTEDNHGLVISLDATEAKWENERRARGCHDIAMLPNEEGIREMTFRAGEKNTQVIIKGLGPSEAPAAEWCVRQGEGWYLPSSGELWYLFSENCDINLINQTIQANNGVEIEKAWYWTSTEYEDEKAINVTFKGKMSPEDKSEELNVRAVRAF